MHDATAIAILIAERDALTGDHPYRVCFDLDAIPYLSVVEKALEFVLPLEPDPWADAADASYVEYLRGE